MLLLGIFHLEGNNKIVHCGCQCLALTPTQGKDSQIDLTALRHPCVDAEKVRRRETRAAKYVSNDENGAYELTTNSIKSIHRAMTKIV
jgi:hypothetical protein